MSFGVPEWFWGLLALPAIALLFVRAERLSAERLRGFAAPRLLPQLAGTVDHFRRSLRFALLLLCLALVLVSLARPRWGYTYEEATRKGLDLLFAVDTSRSMLSTDVQPNRLDRVKLAAQDLVNELQGDRVGLIAFAGRAFLQAPLTIDYGAAIDSITDLDTNSIPEGGTNISDAIALAAQTFGKTATGNRALIIFTDGEELSGDGVKSARAAAEAGMRIFTVGVGTREGSLIPIQGEGGGTAFVKDGKGQVVKSKLDESRLREVAQATGGFYLHLENGPATMRQLARDGLSKLQAGDIDTRTSRRPIERYQWPLGAAILALVASLLIDERRRQRAKIRNAVEPKRALATAALFFLAMNVSNGSSPGLDLYRQDKFPEAFQQFDKTLKENPDARQSDRIQFDAGAAAYKMKDYNKALESFSQALLSREGGLQNKSHYNLGNTLYERGESQKSDEKKIADWTDALRHYEQTLKSEPQNRDAKDNYDFVKKKLEELKKKKEEQPTPTPSPSPSPSPQKKQDQKKDQKDQPDKQGEKQPKSGEQDKEGSKSGEKQDDKGDTDQKQEGASPSPSPNESGSPAPTASPNENQSKGDASPSPSEKGSEGQNPSPSPADKGSPTPAPEGEQGAGGGSPSPSPGKPLTGDVKGADGDKPNEKPAEAAEAEPEKEGEMSEKQAQLLLESMRGEEQKVQLDERRAARHVYNDW